MSRAEIKLRAKEQLGGGIFQNNWLLALLVCIICTVALSITLPVAPGLSTLLLTGPVLYAQQYMFLKQARDGQQMDFNDLLVGFRHDFGKVFLIGFMRDLFTCLWALLFVIPGIVKAYAYSMSMYIAVDHPELDWRQAIKASQLMMKGHKWELFMLELSFIGWFIVGAIAFGVGTFWVEAYLSAAHAQFYESIRHEYIDPRVGYRPAEL